MSKPTELACPTCKKTVFWNDDFPHRPFCSHRCKLIDLGEWANESYTIPVKDSPPDQDNWE
jgi:endogenous inhibitor of DNA gyrase (YacG/DUF329 family)